MLYYIRYILLIHLYFNKKEFKMSVFKTSPKFFNAFLYFKNFQMSFVNINMLNKKFHVTTHYLIKKRNIDPRWKSILILFYLFIDVNLIRNEINTDVVIVGGGPAGLSTAIRFAQLANISGKKYKICLLEKSSYFGIIFIFNI